MNKETRESRLNLPALINLGYIFLALLLFASYVYAYQYAPLSESLNDLVLNVASPLAALMTAAIATAIYAHYHPEDLPRKVWGNLAAGSWMWFIAEMLWVIIDQPLSIADVVWVLGFVFFTIAFYQQYAIIFPESKQKIISVAAGAWAIALLLPLLGLWTAEEFTLSTYINYYYPVADFMVGAAGIALIIVFQGGALLRPWLGLVVFGISDFFYAWAEQVGLYERLPLLTLAIDASYIAAYLILGFGFIGHWILINYGLRGNH